MAAAPGRDRRATEAAPLLVVEMSQTPGQSPLPGARAEARRLAELVPNLTMLRGSRATRAAVLTELPKHRIAPFACHARSDPYAPALDRLLLHDHTSEPPTVIDLSALHIPHADLAFLSACQTARSNLILANEAVHIATAFQLIGYRHVVGTLWPVADRACRHVAGDFYGHLGPSLDTEAAARALHQAVRALRADYPARPSWWAAHIHIGG